jgi:hypothetical protein
MRKRSAAGFGGAVVLLAFGLGATPGVAAGVFDSMSGYWNGTGKVQMSDGSVERIRCRASYGIAGAGHLMQQKLVCASDSYRFDITSNVEERDGRINGTWSEATRNASGQVSGTARGGRVDAQISGPGFGAALSVTTRGASQSVSIVPQGTEVRAISVSMHRR